MTEVALIINREKSDEAKDQEPIVFPESITQTITGRSRSEAPRKARQKSMEIFRQRRRSQFVQPSTESNIE